MRRTSTVLVSVALIAAFGVAVWLLHQQRGLRRENARLLRVQSDLIASNVTFGDELIRLEGRAKAVEEANRALREQFATLAQQQQRALNAQSHGNPPGTGAVAGQAPEPGVVPLRKENLRQLKFDALRENFELTETSKNLLELTPEELARITAVLQALKQRIQAHDQAQVRKVPAEEIKDEDIVRFLKRNPGQPTTFRIPPFSPEEQQGLKAWFGQSLEEVLGTERSQVLVNNARLSLDFWLGGTEDKILAWVNPMDSGKPAASSWMVKFNTPSSHGTYSGESRGDAAPPQLGYLFEIPQLSNP